MSELITGIDIGAVSLRAVTLRRKGDNWECLRFGEVPRISERGGPKPLTLALAELEALCPFKGRVICASSDLKVLLRYIPTVPMPDDRLERLLRLELAQHADEQGDLAADTFVLPVAGNELIHCCAVAQGEEVSFLTKDLAAADVRPDRIHVGTAALGNVVSSSKGLPSDADGYGLIVDVGAKSTRLVLHKGDGFLACRQIAFGGDSFTETLAKERSLDFAKAEAAKIAGEGLSSLQPLRKSQPAAPASPASDTLELVDPPDLDDKDDLDLGDDLFADDTPQQAQPASDPSETAATIVDGNANADTLSESSSDEDELDLDLGLDDADNPMVMQLDADGQVPVAAVSGSQDKNAESAAPASEPWQRPEQSVVMAPPELPNPGAATLQVAAATLGPELTRSAEQLVSQIASSLAWFRSQLKLPRFDLDQVALAGGGAQLAGLAAYLQRRLSTSVIPNDPFFSIDGKRPEFPGRYAVAVGLARSLTPDGISFDLRPDSELRRREWYRSVLWPWVAAALIAAAAVVFGWAAITEQSHHREAIAAFEEQDQRYKQLTGQLAEVQARRKALREDLRGIASRIFAGRDLLYAMRALKQEAESNDELWITDFRTEGLSRDNLQDENERNSRQNTRGGRSTGRGGESNAHRDTIIDRGRIFVRGYVKSDTTKDANEYHQQFVRWMEDVAQWKRPEGGDPLFKDRSIVKNNLDREENRYLFEVRFDFTRTQLGEEAN